jgi:hypothetical protein
VQAISYCDEDFMIQLQGPHLDKAEEVTDPILLNMAAAQLKTGEYQLAAHNSTQVSSNNDCQQQQQQEQVLLQE